MACGVFLGVLSSQSPTDPSEGNESAAAPYIRWDIYKEIGYPQIEDLDGLLNVLKQMQDGLARIPARTTSTPCHCSRIGTAM